METDSQHIQELQMLIPDAQSRSLLINLLQAIPNVVALLDQERKLIFTNQILLDSLSIPSLNEVLHMKPGEIFSCTNSELAPGGCGASEACHLCGAFLAIEDSRKLDDRVTEDYRILSNKDGKTVALNFKLTSTPFHGGDHLFYIVTIVDNSGEIRKQELERIFFHDMINSLSGLQGIILLLQKGRKINDTHLEILEATYKILYQTIKEQKEFSLAESGDLSLNLGWVNSLDVIKESMLTFNENISFYGDLLIQENAENVEIQTDNTLLSRILTNMIKNALEASEKDDKVTIGVSRLGETVRFSVSNPFYIARNDQLQIFERSFSTKGSGRGLGTYSMKLLGENYLQGKVGFTSSEEHGTTFYLELPVKFEG